MGFQDDLTNEMLEKRKQKVWAQDHGLDGCKPDLSDVQFTAGGGNYLLPVIGTSCAVGVIITLRIWMRGRVTGTGSGFGVPAILLAMTGILMGFLIIQELRGSKITVTGKTVRYRGNLYESSEITKIRLNLLGYVVLYAGSRKVCSVMWDEKNAELLIAWADKLGIPFEGKRIKDVRM